MHVCECVRLYGDCIVLVCVSGHGCMVILRVCVGVYMFVTVRVRLYGRRVVFVCVSGNVYV